MKKLYIMPATNVLQIQTTALLVDSLRVNEGKDDDVIESADAILSRERHSLWDDEEE